MAKIVNRHFSLSTAAFLIIFSAVVWTLRQEPTSDDEWNSLLSTRQSGDIHQLDIHHGSNHWQLARDGRDWKSATHDLLSLQAPIDDLASLLVHAQIQAIAPGEDLSEYGLTDEATKVNIHIYGADHIELLIGDPTPDRMHDYLLLDQDVYISRTRISRSIAEIETALLNTVSPLENGPE